MSDLERLAHNRDPASIRDLACSDTFNLQCKNYPVCSSCDFKLLNHVYILGGISTCHNLPLH